MKNRLLLILILLTIILTTGCGKKITESGKATKDKLTETIHNVIGEKIEGKDKIQSLGYSENEVSMTIIQSTLTKGITLSDSAKLFERLFKYDGIDKIYLIWEGSFTDQYGNSEYKPVMIISLSKETADKIKWDNFDYENLEKLADDYKIHDQLK